MIVETTVTTIGESVGNGVSVCVGSGVSLGQMNVGSMSVGVRLGVAVGNGGDVIDGSTVTVAVSVASGVGVGSSGVGVSCDNARGVGLQSYVATGTRPVRGVGVGYWA